MKLLKTLLIATVGMVSAPTTALGSVYHNAVGAWEINHIGGNLCDAVQENHSGGSVAYMVVAYDGDDNHISISFSDGGRASHLPMVGKTSLDIILLRGDAINTGWKKLIFNHSKLNDGGQYFSSFVTGQGSVHQFLTDLEANTLISFKFSDGKNIRAFDLGNVRDVMGRLRECALLAKELS